MDHIDESRLYEMALDYWPYRTSLSAVVDQVCLYAPPNGTLLDMMCGPGYLLGRIAEMRPDLHVLGVDIEARHVEYGRRAHPKISFEAGNVLEWCRSSPFDVVVCTGALHHVPRASQEAAIANIAYAVKSEGFVVLSDCYIDHYANEIQRKRAAARLGYEYLDETIANGAPEVVIRLTSAIQLDDVLGVEFKTSVRRREPILKKYFAKATTRRTWPTESSGRGDYVHVCSQPR